MTVSPNRWLLPEGVSEILPPDADRLERIRRGLLDMYATWGYELVITPFIEYLDSLLLGTSADLDPLTFKIIDPLSGRLMGIRSDMTPQVARIDAHSLIRHQPWQGHPEAPVRLCYLGTVLHTRPDGFAHTRTPLQIGAELYGHAGMDSDLEILALLLETLHAMQLESYYLDVGHVVIYESLAEQAGLDRERETLLFEAMQRKAISDIRELLAGVAPEPREMLEQLVKLNGDRSILREAGQVLAKAPEQARQALEQLEQVAARFSDVPLHFDLAELRGYAYHTGLVFAAYVPGHGQAVAQGGRYDHIGEVFGRARPATGFTADLKILVEMQTRLGQETERIFAPATSDPDLDEAVRRLRAEGRAVIRELRGQTGDARALGCSHVLEKNGDGEWQAVPVDVP